MSNETKKTNMKKAILLQATVLLCATTALAQLQVIENGNVGIGTTNPQYPLSVDTDNSMVGLSVYRNGEIPSAFQGMPVQSAIEGRCSSSTEADYSIGVEGICIPGSITNEGGLIGVRGLAGVTTNGYNFGVLGQLYSTDNYGASICGTDYAGNFLPYIDGHYAGYFQGNVKVTGTINGMNISVSDRRFKQNITTIGGNATSPNSLNSNTESYVWTKLIQLNPVQYNYKQVYLDPDTEKSLAQRAYFDEESQLFQKTHFGLIAQEVQEVFPELVYEEDNGYLALNYTELIPVLLQAVKELKAEVTALQAEKPGINIRKMAAATPSYQEGVPAQVAVLYQNTPNPFSQATNIRYYLPETVATASLCIYDMQGKQLRQIVLTQRGEGAEQISASELDPGMYLYALIADGQEVDVKRMILTE